MRPVSAAWLTTVRGSHQMTARATILDTFQTGTQPTGGTEIEVLGGDVVADATANVRGSLDLLTTGAGLWPSLSSSLLAPYGNEAFVERGLVLGGGSTEWCSLGFYRLQTPTQDKPPDGPIRVSGLDRMAGIIDGRLLAPAQFMSTDTYGAVVTQLVTEVYPLATVQWDDATDTDTLGRSVIVETDRYAFLNDLVRSLGKIWYWDHRGILVILDPPDPTDPVFDVDSGEDGVLVSMSRHLTRERVYNAVVASGEAGDTDAPVVATAIDNNPDSPTYFYGRFGPVPEFFTSPFLTTATQAQSAAEALLRKKLGLPYQVDFAAVPNPALEPYDPVRVRYSDRDAIELHTLQRVTIPLVEDVALTATTREQTTVLIGSL